MQGKELIMRALKGEKTQRTPWLPFVGCHGGTLINATATEYLSDAKLVVKGLNEAVKRYRPDGLPVMFDLQVEAEAMGCELKWADDNPPAVVSHPLAEDPDFKKIALPGKEDGRIPLCMEATRQLRKDQPELALYGLITGPFTLALHLLGSDIFMKMFEDPDYVYGLLDHCKEAGKRMADYYIEAGCDVVAVVDPMTSQIGPDQFEQFVTPPAKEIFAHVNEKGAMSSFFVCGHAQQNIEVMCDTRPDNICIDENIPLEYVKEKALPKKVSFGGNMKLTTVLLMAKPEDCQRHALECIETGGDTAFVLAPGCDLPYATPPENLEAVAQIVHDEYQRDVIRSMEQTEDIADLLDMSEYGRVDKVIVDVITLDSESCAPCQYMVEAVRKVTPQFEGIVEWREHAIKHIDSVNFMASLMVKNIPTICIDGQIAFVSKIPPRDQLIQAIQKRINEKLKLKVRAKKGELLILGKDQAQCDELKPIVERAINELGADIKYIYVTDPKEIAAFGVIQTPAIITAGYKLKAEGTVPHEIQVREWIKEII